jgi:hypothetical protein
MEQKDIDVYEILKDVPKGTEFYTSLCGNVGLAYLESNKEAGEAIWTKNKDGEYSFNKNGRWMKGGEVTFFPSKQMRDWSKFFKKGDVLEYKKENNQATCIFDSYEDNTTKLHFTGLYTLTKGKILDTPTSWATFDWVKSDNPDAYIKTIEERLGGKLNRETLEIEKPAKLKFEVGRFYVFNEDDEEGELTIIGKLIDKNESEDTLTFGDQYEIENQKFVTDQTFDLRISVQKELREATEGEILMFQKARDIWRKEKEAREHPAFKTFDKVLVRCGKKFKWLPAFFVRDRGDDFAARYNVLPIHSGKPADFTHCIPFEGHENIAFTDYDIENLPF